MPDYPGFPFVFQMILNKILNSTKNYIKTASRDQRKGAGQFFTPVETAIFMSSLFNFPSSPHLKILDPGAGSGILTAAVLERFQMEQGIRSVSITCYETDEKILPLLRENLELMKAESDISVDYRIHASNYIVSQKDDFRNRKPGDTYDIVISNPPYKKINMKAEEAQVMREICHGAPNLYFLFAAMALFDLKPGGELVCIIPRSWTSGAYFRKFREYLFKNGTILRMHLFQSRNRVFSNENMLQEVMILHAEKGRWPGNIMITSSEAGSGYGSLSGLDVPSAEIICGSDRHVLLPVFMKDLDVIRMIQKLPDTLRTLGLRMRTGLTVGFRNREYILDFPMEGSVPLYYSRHIRNGKVIFPDNRGKEYLAPQAESLYQKNKNYLFMKRFAPKEEERRMQCGIYLSYEHSDFPYISTDNKLNFIDKEDGELTKEQVTGLYVLFNSTLYDRYYRILDGSTQVNASEINTIPVPDMGTIGMMGRELIRVNSLSTESCDRIMAEVRGWIP